MNPRFDPPQDPKGKDPQSIRSDIDSTRQRMDAKIDAIGARLKGRHLVDEVVGFFRSKSGNGNGHALKEKLTDSAGVAMHSIVDSVKKHPLPTLLIGAGVAWLIYENSRSKTNRNSQYSYDPNETYGDVPYDPDAGDAPLGYSTEELNRAQGYEGSVGYSAAGEGDFDEAGQGKFQGMKDNLAHKASDVKQRVQQKAAQFGERVQQRSQAMRGRASEIRSRVQQRAQQAYNRGRQQVVTTADQYPIEVGLGLLALGLIAGLSLPTPQKVNQLAGPTADRLRRRARETGRDYVERGRHVVQAAASAVKEEARAQGLTAEALRQKATSVAERAKQAATDTARNEGVVPQQGQGQQPQQSGQQTPVTPQATGNLPPPDSF
jgi:hypothetical protein